MRRISSLFCCLFFPFAVVAQPEPQLKDYQPSPAASAKSRVVVVHNESAIQTFVPNSQIIRKMVDRGILETTGKADLKSAWNSLISPNDIVGIKVYTRPGAVAGTRPSVVGAVIEGLLEAGLPPRQIVIWDKRVEDLQAAGFFELAENYEVRIEGSAAAGYDEEKFYETSLVGKLVWGDLEFGRKTEGVGRKSFVSNLVTKDITKIISVAPLLNHHKAGVTGHIYGLAMDSVDNTFRFKSSRVHLNTAGPELYAMEILGDRVALNIVDALICQYQGEQQSLLHYSSILNELRFSKDPLALDVMSVRELERQRQKAELKLRKPDMEFYFNAGLLQIGAFDPKQVRVEKIELD